MTISLVHAFNSEKADGTDTTLVQPSDWNAEHVLEMATARVLGRHTAGTGAVEELSADQLYDILGLIGKTMVFNDTTPPTGWTQKTAVTNAALRLIGSGTVGTGGTANFTSVFAARTIAQANIPSYNLSASLSVSASGSTSTNGSHNHSYTRCENTSTTNNEGGQTVGRADGASTSSDGSHNHSVSVSGTASGSIHSGGSGTAMDFAVKYVDVILATKDAIA